MVRNIIFFSIISLFASTVTSCGSGVRSTNGVNGQRSVITVSIPPLRWFVEQIAGDSVEVNVLMSSGGNPETFEPTVSAMRQASESEVLLTAGTLAFEQELARKIASGSSAPVIVNTSEGIDILHGSHGKCTHAGHHHDHDADPHTWTSVKNGKIIARNIYHALTQGDPARGDYYRGRYDALTLYLDSLDADFASRLESHRGESFLVMHPSLGYFARDYDLEQISIGQEGRESSIKTRRSQIDHADGAGVKLLFLQADFDSRQAATVARSTSSRIVEINPLNPGWDIELIHITDALSQ